MLGRLREQVEAVESLAMPTVQESRTWQALNTMGVLYRDHSKSAEAADKEHK